MKMKDVLLSVTLATVFKTVSTSLLVHSLGTQRPSVSGCV